MSVQIYAQGVVLVLGGHVTNLAGVPSDATFVSPTHFSVTLSGIVATGAAHTTTSATGTVSAVTLTPSTRSTQVDVDLRSARSHDQISVGGGDEIQVLFS